MLYYHLSPRESETLKATGSNTTETILENDIVKKTNKNKVREDREG